MGDGGLIRIQELCGLWRRSLLAFPDGRSDTTTEVRWLQGLSRFADLRRPPGLPASPARCRDELSLATCRDLARQQGFAGCLVETGGFFEWRRSIDYQPEALHADAGTLTWDGDTLVERGRDVVYLEHWHRDAARDAPGTGSAAPVGALDLEDADSGVRGALVRVAQWFMFARDRQVAPRRLFTLSECVAAAPDLAAAQALVDCEISFGRAAGDAFSIVDSTLPYRVGERLEPRFDGPLLTTRDRAAAGGATLRRWRITAAEGAAAAGLP